MTLPTGTQRARRARPSASPLGGPGLRNEVPAHRAPPTTHQDQPPSGDRQGRTTPPPASSPVTPAGTDGILVITRICSRPPGFSALPEVHRKKRPDRLQKRAFELRLYSGGPHRPYEARNILNVAGTRRNGGRWSVALALGIRQGEALGLHWQYVDLEIGVIRTWFQIQRTEWQHGCADPHKCGEKWRHWPCKKKCSDHGHNPGCKKQGHTCFKRTCLKDCTSHADKCPKRTGGGIVFRQRKGKSKLTLQCSPELLALLKAHRKIQATERLKAGDRWEDHDLVFATRHGGPIERTEDWKVWKTILKQARPGARRSPHCRDAAHRAGGEHPGRSGGPGTHEGGHDRALCTCVHTAHARRRGTPGLGTLGGVLNPRCN